MIQTLSSVSTPWLTSPCWPIYCNPRVEAPGGGRVLWGDTDKELAREEAEEPPRLEDACESRSMDAPLTSRSREYACVQPLIRSPSMCGVAVNDATRCESTLYDSIML